MRAPAYKLEAGLRRTGSDHGDARLGIRRERKGRRVAPTAVQKTTPVIRIAISPAAFDAICATLPLGSVAVEPYYNERGECTVWLETAMADRLGAMRGPGESYDDVILKLAAEK